MNRPSPSQSTVVSTPVTPNGYYENNILNTNEQRHRKVGQFMTINILALVLSSSQFEASMSKKKKRRSCNRPTVQISWENLTLNVTENKKKKPILKNITGKVCPGELTAIMGPSGAGKSTLLNILSGYSQQKIEGRILVNKKERDFAVFHKISCYIMQDDDLPSHLTVKEVVSLAGQLKIPETISKEERSQRVSDVIEALGLSECIQTRTGQLSGGQRKRLSIAQELVSNPTVLFLDEPTSGLDSSTSLHCIEMLKTLASGGRTIVCTIHQPSARVFELFDKLYMLAAGQCIYRGSTRELLPFLAGQGLQCPPYHNPADFVSEVAAGEHGMYNERLRDAVSKKPGEMQPGAHLIGLFGELNDCHLWNTGGIQILPEKEFSGKEFRGYPTSSLNQFKVLYYRTMLSTLREPMTTSLRLAAHVVVGFLIGMLYFNIGNDAAMVFDNSGCLFFCLMFLIFTAMMPTVLTFPMEMSVFLREHLNSWYSTKMYYMAKTLADMPFQIIFPVIYITIVYWMSAQPAEIDRFGLSVLTSVMVSLVAQSLGLLIGALTNIQNAVFLAPVMSIPILLFSGFFINLDAIPFYLKWMSYMSYIRYGFSSILIAVYGFERPQLECNKLFCPYQDPLEYLKQRDILQDELWLDYVVLLIFFLGLRVLAYIILKWKVRRRR